MQSSSGKHPPRSTTRALGAIACGVALVLCAAGPAAADEKPPSSPSVRAGAEGFALRSADGAFQLKLRGYAHLDGRFVLDDPQDVAADTFVLRRVRPIVEGTLFSWIDFRVMPDFGDGRTVIQDAYVDLKPSKALRIRAGKFKPPVGLERLQSATSLLFVERAFPTSLVPNRDLGIQLHGDLFGDRLSYALGVFNGVLDGSSADADTNDGKEVAGRLFGKPIRGLGIGIAASTGRQSGVRTAPGLASFRTSGQQTFFTYLSGATALDTTIANGTRTRVSPQATYVNGPFGVLAEYVVSTQKVARGTAGASLSNRAVQVAATWVLFGGKASFEGIKPEKAFSPGGGGWGAVDLVARVSELRLDGDTFPVFAEPGVAARNARSWGVGVNWTVSGALRVLLDFERTRFEGGSRTGDRPSESLLASRLQLVW